MYFIELAEENRSFPMQLENRLQLNMQLLFCRGTTIASGTLSGIKGFFFLCTPAGWCGGGEWLASNHFDFLIGEGKSLTLQNSSSDWSQAIIGWRLSVPNSLSFLSRC